MEKSGGNETKVSKISTKTVAVEQSNTTLNGEQGSYFQKSRSRCVIFLPYIPLSLSVGLQ